MVKILLRGTKSLFLALPSTCLDFQTFLICERQTKAGEDSVCRGRGGYYAKRSNFGPPPNFFGTQWLALRAEKSTPPPIKCKTHQIRPTLKWWGGGRGQKIKKILAFWGPLISMTAEKKIPKKKNKKNNKKSEKSFQSGPNLMSFAFNRGGRVKFPIFF